METTARPEACSRRRTAHRRGARCADGAAVEARAGLASKAFVAADGAPTGSELHGRQVARGADGATGGARTAQWWRHARGGRQGVHGGGRRGQQGARGMDGVANRALAAQTAQPAGRARGAAGAPAGSTR